MQHTNGLTPITEFDSSYFDFDLPGLKIGIAEYEEGPTGCTVFVFEGGAMTEVDIRGGLVGQSESEYSLHHAICFAGGSLHGLEAVSGVRAALTKIEDIQTFPTPPLVAGAILWDYHNRRNSSIYPDKALGFAAVKSALEGRFFYGRRGAGRSAGMGQGGAYRQIGKTKIAVFIAINSFGDIVDRNGRVLTRDNRHPIEKLEKRLKNNEPFPSDQTGKHTTLSIVITNQKWSARELNQIGKQVHASMARAIHPFHTIQDGDILFTASTEAVENDVLKSSTDFGLIVSELAWDAVINSLGNKSE